MMENDDKLLTSFFAEHRQEIADNGFSRRVLRHLPDRSRHLAQIWTAFCFTLALVLFVSLDGVQLILDTLRETFDTAIRSGASGLTQVVNHCRSGIALFRLPQDFIYGIVVFQ